MKKTRQSTGLLFLAYEQEEFDTVLDLETTARQAVELARTTLESAPKR
jgi:hypothetical protein